MREQTAPGRDLMRRPRNASASTSVHSPTDDGRHSVRRGLDVVGGVSGAAQGACRIPQDAGCRAQYSDSGLSFSAAGDFDGQRSRDGDHDGLSDDAPGRMARTDGEPILWLPSPGSACSSPLCCSSRHSWSPSHHSVQEAPPARSKITRDEKGSAMKRGCEPLFDVAMRRRRWSTTHFSCPPTSAILNKSQGCESRIGWTDSQCTAWRCCAGRDTLM